MFAAGVSPMGAHAPVKAPSAGARLRTGSRLTHGVSAHWRPVSHGAPACEILMSRTRACARTQGLLAPKNWLPVGHSRHFLGNLAGLELSRHACTRTSPRLLTPLALWSSSDAQPDSVFTSGDSTNVPFYSHRPRTWNAGWSDSDSLAQRCVSQRLSSPRALRRCVRRRSASKLTAPE